MGNDWETVEHGTGNVSGDPIDDAALKLHALLHPAIPETIDVLCHPGIVDAVVAKVPLYERKRVHVRGTAAVKPDEVFLVPHFPDGRPIGYLD